MFTDIKTKVIVLGSGPAGYSAAFRCADLGLETVIIEQYSKLGGVCLNVGCIPSKTFLHLTKIIKEAKELINYGIVFNDPKIDINNMRAWKENVINKLTNGIISMAKGRNVKIINGIGKFTGTNTLEVNNKEKKILISFEYAIIATGSSPIKLPFISYDDPRIWNSTDALNLKTIPKRMLVIGGGIIGIEISTIYRTLGSEVDIIETCNQIIPSLDKDIIEIFTKIISSKFNLMLETKATKIEIKENGIYVYMDGKKVSSKPQLYDVILIAVGRTPNSKNLDITNIGVKLDNCGFVLVDKKMRTNIPHIFAVGDIVGHPMLAHKGMHEGHIAAEVIAGMNHYFEPKVIPSVVYTEPELAWTGLTEKEAVKQGIVYDTSIFPWNASGRAIASNYIDGVTKLIFNKETRRIIGGAIIGSNGGELIGEVSLAIEMGCDAADIALTIHAHPTLYESIGLAAKLFEGTVTDLMNTRTNKYF